MELTHILETVREYTGIGHKQDIAAIAPKLPALPQHWHPNGDDTAAIPEATGFTLMAIEGFINEFVKQDPWFAGWCGVMVNISDIAAMGGRPRAVVNALWDDSLENAQLISEGMVAAAESFGVPIVGGHTNLRAAQPQLAVAILGHANKLLSAFDARPGHILVAAIDHRGQFREPYLNWNAATEAPPEQLRGDIALLPEIAERNLAFAAKDISQAGLLGTALMLLESSGVGAEINLEATPKPDTISWADWLCAFPSFGYLLTTDIDKLPQLLELFQQREITAAPIGKIVSKQQLWVSHANQRQLFRDLKNNPLTGFKPQ
ncbi:sll0787 family AIR synthase-like protein [Marinobacter sp.]|uniref:sll0787 family AIR synthase-like protein n=1 Tax=Marinobacter sp. TaxID=50741 RepID=UPI003B524390